MHHINDYEDLRIQNTKQKIFDALTRLLKTTSFSKISVSDIANEAQISRGAFYHNFNDKYQLVESYMKNAAGHIYSKIQTTNTDTTDVKSFIESILKVHSTESDLLGALLSDNGTLEVHHKVRDTIKNMIKAKLLPKHDFGTASELEKDYLTVFISNAIFGVLQRWLSNGRQETPEEVAEIIVKIIPAQLLRIVYPSTYK
ncbi:MAG: TetR/AcrR family transcriptional regulator [Micrococcaceae bacterium]